MDRAREHLAPARAIALVAELDRGFRVRGNEPYRSALDAIERELARFLPPSAIQRIALGPEAPAWTPRSASLELRADASSSGPLLRETLSFARPEDAARTMLAIHSFSTGAGGLEAEVRSADAPDLRGAIALGGPDPEGAYETLVRGRGAAGVLVAPELDGPGGQDGIAFGAIPFDPERRSFGILLPRSLAGRLRALLAAGTPVKARVVIDAAETRARAETVVVTLRGTVPSARSAVVCAHVDEPGANDNASGAAALVEVARALASAPRLARTVRLLWGTEFESPGAWLAEHPDEVGFAIALDMVGEDPRAIGPLLVERPPDPGAVWTRLPDRHTGWGESEVDPASLRGTALADLLAAALALAPPGVTTHPFEGGSDHVPFLDRGIPAVLVWHFPDDAYHTSLDRLERVSAAEIVRVVSGVVATLELLGRRDAALGDAALVLARDAALRRLEHALAAALPLIAAGRSTLDQEEQIVRAWALFADQALHTLDLVEDGPSRVAARHAARRQVARRARATIARLRGGDPMLR